MDMAFVIAYLVRKEFFFVKTNFFRQLSSARAHDLEILSNTFSFFSLKYKQ